jgi:hypothetical protein
MDSQNQPNVSQPSPITNNPRKRPTLLIITTIVGGILILSIIAAVLFWTLKPDNQTTIDNTNDSTGQSNRNRQRQSDLERLLTAVVLYQSNNGQLPDSKDSFQAVIDQYVTEDFSDPLAKQPYEIVFGDNVSAGDQPGVISLAVGFDCNGQSVKSSRFALFITLEGESQPYCLNS